MRTLYYKTVNFINKHFTAIKLLFALFVLGVVIYVGSGIISDVSGPQMLKAFRIQTPTSLSILLVLGFISVLPMLTYDFSMVDLLPSKFKTGYIVKSGWIVNTLTNIAGFGGFLGASLRAHFYSKGSSKKQIIYALSKVALFLLAGLSTYCLVALVMIFGFHVDPRLERYWYILLAGGIYFPAIFIFTRVKNFSFFKDLTLNRELKLILGSCCEWGGCAALFIIIGAFMHVHVDLVSIFPLFIIANVAGVVSMMPGGLGGFDVVMVGELKAMGLSTSAALVWDLLYRAFYYIAPVTVGIILLIHDTGRRINNSLDGIPATIIQRTAQIVLTIFMYFSAIMMLLLATVPNFALVNKVYLSLEPYTFYFLDQLTNMIFAFIFIGLARGIGSRIKKAFWPTVIVMVIAMANSLWKQEFPISMCVTFAIILICLWLSKGCLYREKLTYSWGQKIMDTIIFTVTFIIYSFVGIYTRYRYAFLHFSNTYLFPSYQVWFAGFLGLLVAILIVIIIYRFLSHKNVAWLNQPFDVKTAKRVRNVINKYGGNEISHLAFMRDKQIYFYRENHQDQLFFMFKQKANKLVIMGEPVGNRAKMDPAVDQFMNDADKLGMSLVFYEVGERFTMLLHEKGFDFTKFGEEGFVDLQNFSLAGSKHRGDRALMHKFERKHYQFEIVKPPFKPEFLKTLRHISDDWLDGNQEKGFSLGYFDDYYLSQAPIAIMKDPKGKIISFANLMPNGNHNVTSIDLMRSLKSAPSGIMDGIFITLFKKARDDGYQIFNLGMAPLSNVGESKFSFVDERLAHLIFKYGYKFYSFKGLRDYKNKFVSDWKPRYIVYRKRSSLIFTMLQLLLLVNQHVNKKDKHPSLIQIFSNNNE